MLKHKAKQPTPQELYKARMQREEEERDANLPPGMINHGNTCFMNSTLQGLIATPLLHSLVNFEELPAAGSSLASWRSPQLTNGHGQGGQYEQEWVQGMPLGDVFVTLMQKAWNIQQIHRRESMSPKELLTTIGRKYDQYLDFRQQDAHEFLRHMLDAMRMEELDIIKARQPPSPKNMRRKRRTTREHITDRSATPNTPSEQSSPPNGSTSQREEEKLESFVDMLFGGKLASFLVCDTCKKVSVTYEDFNDLSLSIKPEDYVKERKRDRFKLLAQKLRLRPKELDVSAAMAGIIPVQRSSSVPVTPARRSMDTLPHDPEPPVNVDHRRRSFDTHGGTDEANEERTARDVVKDLANTIKGSEEAVEIDEDLEVGAAEHKDPKATGRVEFAELSKDDNGQERRADGEHKKEKDDAWGKLGRRISVSMGMSKKDKRMSRSKDRGLKAKHLKDDASSRVPSEERAPRIPIRSAADSGSELGDVSDVAKSRGISPSPAPSPLSSPAFINPAGPFPNIRRSSGLALADKLSKPMTRLPKPSKEEIAYMRQVLADVHPSSHNTFSMLHQALSGGNSSSPNLSTAPTTAQALLVKLGHLPGIEECLRLFTAVELMDGENMVGCHRCWKIANGTYKPHNHVDSQEADGEESEDSSQDDRVLDISKDAINAQRDEEHGEDIQTSSPDSPGYVIISSSSTPSFPRSASSSSLFLHDTTSVPSAPTTMQSHTEDEGKQQPRSSSAEETVNTYGGMPIPFISTTAPDTPVPSAPATARVSSDVSAVRDLAASLLSPATKRHRRRRKASGLDESTDSSGNESYDSASDISGDASAYSDASSVASPSASPTVSPRTSLEKLRESVAALRPPNDTTPSGSSTSPARKVPHSQQVIMRRTFKRYLIAVPPPILVVHLKRFQQISKNNPYAMAFSGGFKKLDDFVAFPEYLELKPFLAPKKEDFGLGKKKGKNRDQTKEGRCMYRLYAVVVHIGNMLGGHYVAYTALPPSKSLVQQTSNDSVSSVASAATSKPPSIKPETMSAESSTSHRKETESPRKWAYISDQVVRLTTLEEVLKAKAYICMYERI